MPTTKLELIISAQNKASAELARLSGDLNKVQGKTASAGASLGKLAAYLGGATAAYFAIKKGILDSVHAWEEQEKATAQTEAVLKSMGGQSGMTAKAVGELATSLMEVTTYSDETIQAAENLLLTFGNIKDKIFPQATETVLDMSYALGEDLKGSAIRVGKALQDPILGVTALRRVGVNFNQTQTEVIRKLVETGKGLEAQQLILKELSREFGGSARKALETYGGRIQWLKNQANELKEAFGRGITKGLTDAFMQGVTGINDFNSRMAYTKSMFTSWGSALVNGFTFVIRSLWNIVQIAGRIIATPFTLAYAAAYDAIQNLMNLMSGDFTTSWDTFKNAWETTAGGIGTDIEDMKNAFVNAYVSVDGATNDMADTFNAGGATVADFGEATDGAAKKIEEATKKIKDMKDEMKKAVASAKQDIKDLKEEFKKTEITAQKDLGKSIADVILQKQSDLKAAQTDYNKATTNEEKRTAQDKIITITDFLNAHLTEQQKFASEIIAAQQFAAMDEIQQLYFKFEEEKKIRLADYKDQLKDLKKHLKDVEKEYKEKLKDLRSDLLKELGNIKINIDINKSSKKQFGGSVSTGQNYLVGEHRPEVFVPSQSGNIRQTNQTGSREITINFNNVSVRNDNDLDSIVRAVRKVINKEQEFYRIGAI